MKTLTNILIIGLMAIGLYSFTSSVYDGWVVPGDYKAMVNPTDPDDDEGLEIGEELYMKHCKSCHGKEGLGDGTKADELEGDLGDFSSEEFQAQTDGDLFYKSKEGRDDMPEFSKKIPDDEEIWFVVNYIRTLGE